jgi:hypothetical protein
VSKIYRYMNKPDRPVNFGLLGATGAATAGGALYGTAYTGAKSLLDRDRLTPEQWREEALANAAGGAASGAGLYLMSKTPGLLNKFKQSHA